MKNSKSLNIKFFWQNFCQLKRIGIVCTILLMLIITLPRISTGMIMRQSNSVRTSEIASYSLVSDMHTTIINASDFSVALLLTFVIMTPLLVLNAWSFLNKRSTSDFYHSLPIRREGLYCIKLAAVLLWQIIIFAAAYLAFIIVFLCFKDIFIVNHMEIFRMFLALFICNLLCGAAISLACSITGNIFSNMCLSGLILFFPSCMTYITSQVLRSITIVFAGKSVIPGIDLQHNILTGIIFSVFSSDNIYNMIFSVQANIYTFALALIYAVLGCLLFINRKSETAGRATLNSWLQFLIRTLIGFVVSCIGVVLVLIDLEMDKFEAYDIVTVLEFFIIAAVVVFVYEMISGKYQKNILKCIYSIATAYMLAIIFGGAIHIGVKNVLNYSPQQDKISYVQFVQQRGYDEDISYFEYVFTSIKISDPQIISIVADTARENAQLVRDKKDYRSRFHGKNTEMYTVYIKDNILGKYRDVYFTQEDMQKIMEQLAELEGFKNAYLDLPQFEAVKVRDMPFNNKDELKKVYDTLIQESHEIEFKDWYANTDSYTGIYFDIAFTKNGKSYMQHINISEKLPKTLELCLNICNEQKANNDSLKKAADVIDNFISTDYVNKYKNFDCSVEIFGKGVDDIEYVHFDDSVIKLNNENIAFFEKVKEAITNPQSNQDFDMDNVIIRVRASKYLYEDNIYAGQKECEYYFQLPDYKSLSDMPKLY